jgi:hypothetical protein
MRLRARLERQEQAACCRARQVASHQPATDADRYPTDAHWLAMLNAGQYEPGGGMRTGWPRLRHGAGQGASRTKPTSLSRWTRTGPRCPKLAPPPIRRSTRPRISSRANRSGGGWRNGGGPDGTMGFWLPGGGRTRCATGCGKGFRP